MVRYTHDKGGMLRGVSFALNGVAVKGQEVGYKGAELREAFQGTAAPAKEQQRGQEQGLPTPTDQKKPGQKRGSKI